jgi:hypothetical protein
MLVFCDSFDYYGGDVSTKWTPGLDGAGSIDLVGGHARTGRGCMVLDGAVFGPYRAINPISHIIVGDAIDLAGGATGYVFMLVNTTAAGGVYSNNVAIQINPDLSVGWSLGTPGGYTPQGASAPNVCIANGYNYIEAEVKLSLTATGSVKIRVNGQVVYSVSGVVTVGFFIPSAICDTVRLCGSGGTSVEYHDDFYILDCSTPPNDAFFGAVRIYACLPKADSTPLQWTPSVAGLHYPLVNSVPPDLTKWVESNTVGQQDLYIHDVSAIPSTVNVLACQHDLLGLVDAAGARSIASSVNGNVDANSFALSTSGSQYLTQYDTDPVTGLAWQLTDLVASRELGPAVTS